MRNDFARRPIALLITAHPPMGTERIDDSGWPTPN
jgi:hypothetical protein